MNEIFHFLKFQEFIKELGKISPNVNNAKYQLKQITISTEEVLHLKKWLFKKIGLTF